MKPIVADIYHGDTVEGAHCEGFCEARAAGLQGVIHKASQGRGMVDSAYAYRRPLAVAAGLLWGAYHFNTGDSVSDQVAHFFACAEPDESTLMALDFEDNRLSNMTAAQMVDFLQKADAKLGRKLVIYGGNRIKEHMPTLPADVQAFVCEHPLWLCQYGPKAKLPAGWKDYFLWQYTGDGIGPVPHKFPGFEEQGLDLNVFNGLDLAKAWAPGVCKPQAPLPAPTTAQPSQEHNGIAEWVKRAEALAASVVKAIQ